MYSSLIFPQILASINSNISNWFSGKKKTKLALRLCSPAMKIFTCSNLPRTDCHFYVHRTLWAQQMGEWEGDDNTLRAFLPKPPCRTCKKEQVGIKLQDNLWKPRSNYQLTMTFKVSVFWEQYIFINNLRFSRKIFRNFTLGSGCALP